MQADYDHDGSVRRIHNSIVTGYWSGYAVNASAPYSSASATFQVPSVTHDNLAPTATEYVSQWVGIGGYGDSTLIQLGAMEFVSPSNAPTYLAWYELYPAGAIQVPHSVKPGDTITASLQCTAACSPSSVQTWQLSLSDQTAGWTWTQSFQYQSTMASAEWITEAPGSTTLPLANYGQATFDPVEANGLNPNLSLSANGIIMQDPYGETSNPSAPVNGDVFSTCWGARRVDILYSRVVYHAATCDDGLTFGQSENHQLGAVLDAVVELDKRHVLRGQWLLRVRDLGLCYRFSDRDDLLLGRLHWQWRVCHRSGDRDNELAQHLPRKEVQVSTMA
jgi:hypothetical protein